MLIYIIVPACVRSPEYILVSHYLCRFEKFTRQADEIWIYSKYQSNEHVVKIESVNCELPVSEIYRKVSFDKHRLKINNSDTKTTT